MDTRTDVPMDTGRDVSDVTPDAGMDVVDVQMDVVHDVPCDTTCPDRPNAMGACMAGSCGITCMTGFADCNHDATDGCEVGTQTSGANCGTCGHACGATEGCMAGTCAACPSGQMSCSGSCTDVTTDLQNCGTCANACPLAGPHQAGSCAASACQYTCDTGFTDCDSSPTNGCEANFQADITNCGACGHVCTVPAGSMLTPVCTLGVCGISMCPPGTADCDGNTVNGCEVNTTTSAMNCGSCGHSCPSGAHSTASCNVGLCGLTCTNPYADCDGNAANGCEVSLNAGATSPTGAVANCGACGVTCPAQPAASHSTAACNTGNCSINCSDATNFLNCDGLNANGCEQSIHVSQYCGSCIHNCLTEVGAGAICLSNLTCSTNPANTSCPVATAVPVVTPGTAAMYSGPLPHGTSEQWFHVTFVMRSGSPGAMYASTPTIALTPPPGRPMQFDISTGSCASHPTFACNSGTPGGSSQASTGLHNWSFTDVATDPQGATVRADPVDPNTATFFIRVYNAPGAVDGAAPFTLRITNP